MGQISKMILSIYEDVEADVAIVVKPTKSKVGLMALSFAVTVVLFIICYLQKGVFFSGIVYAGHGWFGWICLWLSCMWTATILCAFVLWFLGLSPLKRPRWAYFAAGVAFLLLFVSGLSWHLPDPMLGEMLVGSAAALPLFLSLFVEKH